MYHVSKLDESRFAVPVGYERRARGYERASLVDHTMGSVHTGAAICRLAPGGYVDTRTHVNEKGIYVLAGALEVLRGEREAFRLAEDEYALVPYGSAHALRNSGTKPVRWFEVQAPQPKPPGGWQDTFFAGSAVWPARVNPARDSTVPMTGRFREEKPIVPAGKGVSGLAAYRFMDQAFGATCFYLMRGVLDVGGERSYHDHTVEECYFALSGESYMNIEGERFHLRPGDIAWTGVGACHAFHQTGDIPFRWIETQAPQFPPKNGTRYYIDWEK
jgi:mannose-6-phosphate isomerase-like protein (cupin superfamily)